MKIIPLNHNYVALVDDDVYARLRVFRWRASIRVRADGTKMVYAIRTTSMYLGPRKNVYMHKEISGYPQTDHKDGNGLNNQRSAQ